MHLQLLGVHLRKPAVAYGAANFGLFFLSFTNVTLCLKDLSQQQLFTIHKRAQVVGVASKPTQDLYDTVKVLPTMP
jgi:hypothetical protein